MTINIEMNDYVQDTQVREEAVQGICDAFLEHCIDSTFHPYSDGRFRDPTVYLWKWKRSPKYIGFESERNATDSYAKENKDVIRINGAEMKAAFEVLINAGYHMYKTNAYGTWPGYVVNKKPFLEGATEVFSFDDFID